MRPCLPSYENVNTLRKGGLNYASEWLLSIRLLMLVNGKASALGIGDSARISSTSAAAPSSTTYTSWPVPRRFKLASKMSLNYLTGSLDQVPNRASQKSQGSAKTGRRRRLFFGGVGTH